MARIPVEIRRSPFPGEVYAVLAQPNGQPIVLRVDARDVDVREGTMPVNVLHVRAGLAKVSQMMVRDCPDAPMPGPPVAHFDAEGDRGGIVPGDPIPSETDEDVRARFEAEADARSQARAEQLPKVATDDDPEDERTRVYGGRPKAQRPTLLGGLAGGPMPRPTSPSSPTLVSPGVEVLGSMDETAEDGSLTVRPERDDGAPVSDVPPSSRR
jgi:hypothetical protein